MKTNEKSRPISAAFTLVEVLVVIVIIATLAAIGLTLGPKMMKRGDAARSVQNMRQIGALMGTYAADNNSTLPKPRGDIPNETGGFERIHWYEALLKLVYTDEAEDFNEEWWLANKPFMRNPLCDENTLPYAWAHWNPGYAFNRQIIANLKLAKSDDWSEGKGGPQDQAVPMALIPDPGRTPLVAPRGDWHFTYNDSEIKEAGLKPFLVDSKMPILFVDGHVESMPLSEYTSRRLVNVPTPKP